MSSSSRPLSPFRNPLSRHLGRLAVSALALAIAGLASSVASAGAGDIEVEIGPLAGAPSARRTVTIKGDLRRQVKWRDLQDGTEHNVRGVSLREFGRILKLPKAADTAIFVYQDGMQIPVHLQDKDEVDAVFIAIEHGDARDRFSPTYPLLNRAELPCPKVVYGRRAETYSIWLYPTALTEVRFVSWKTYEADLAQATRRVPDRSGFPLYVQHCAPCHGIGGHGAKRAPDFLTDMAAYRRVPPLAETEVGTPPSLHEKVKGFVEGTMPVLNHIPDKDVIKLWRWLHAIHASATK